MEVVISFLQLIAFLQFVVDFHTDKYCLAHDFAALFFFSSDLKDCFPKHTYVLLIALTFLHGLSLPFK